MPPTMSSSKASTSASATALGSEPPAPLKGMQGISTDPKEVLSIINSLKEQVAAERCIYKRMEENRLKLFDMSNILYKFSLERRNNVIIGSDKSLDLLTRRQKDAIDMQGGIGMSNGDKDSNDSLEDSHASSAILLGSSIAVKNAVRPIKLMEVKRLPPYTTWIFLDRNQRMTEDQSVVGRRRIYYDQNGGEALICSDSEEEIIEEEEEKKEFGESEDYILRMTVKEAGLSDAVFDTVAQCLSRKPSEVKRYEPPSNILYRRDMKSLLRESILLRVLGIQFLIKILMQLSILLITCFVVDVLSLIADCMDVPRILFFLLRNKSLRATLMRKMCHVAHIVINCSPMQVDAQVKPLLYSDGIGIQLSTKKSLGPSVRRKPKLCQSETAFSNVRNISESSDSDTKPAHHISASPQSSSPLKSKLAGKYGIHKRNSKRVAECVLFCMRKRQKKMLVPDSDSVASGSLVLRDMKLRSNSRKENEVGSSSQKPKSLRSGRPRKKESPILNSQKMAQKEDPDGSLSEVIADQAACCDNMLARDKFVGENICKQEPSDGKPWKTVEKALYEKGLEIFGRNSCLIARNIMNGMKTCSEIFLHMNCSENMLSFRAGDGVNYLQGGYSKVDCNETMYQGNELRRKSRFLRRRGRVRRLKYTWKSAGYHSIRKRISERKDQPCRQYNPCGCQTACGKDCPCLVNGTCCEKYCGCPKICKNRFRGCHCAKSQCRSRQCPCFAADRECDPDVCRNCWVSCGDGTLGVPSQRGDNYECRNMKLLLKQQQKALLGRSDVSGWGAFLKNSVGKHEYLGEYTGELISHREADKRGKIYDRENSSFLFNLNDQFVLDAYRKGDKLKFANHSPDPNCYAKVIMVAGDHRVGIFAKERITAGEELFYDYRYEPDRAPAWARKPEALGPKKEETGPSSGRAKKLA
ncbi:Histone-lysine N-methyltransferase [Bertholletia excelsa]